MQPSSGAAALSAGPGSAPERGGAPDQQAAAAADDRAAAAAGGGADDGDELPVLDPVSDYEKIKRIGEGTFGIVCELRNAAAAAGRRSFSARACAALVQLLRALLSGPAPKPQRPCSPRNLCLAPADKARDKRSGEVVALKKLRMERERDGVSPCSVPPGATAAAAHDATLLQWPVVFLWQPCRGA